MAASIITLANAVVTDLNGHEFSVPFTATRAYVPKFDTITPATGLQVLVVPKADVREMSSAGYDVSEMVIDIGVFKRLTGQTADEVAEVDGLLALCDEIKAAFNRRRLSAVDWAIATKTAHDAIYSVQELNETRVFLTVLSITFRASLAL